MPVPRRDFCVPCFALLVLGMGTSALGGEWRFGLGPVYRGGMDLEVGGSSYVQTMGLHAATPSHQTSASGPAKEIYPPHPYRSRTFDDGYVLPDPGTFSGDGMTWYWGYDSPDQYDPEAHTLAFTHAEPYGTTTRTESRTTMDVLRDLPVEAEDDLDGWGLQVEAAYGLTERGRCRWSVEAGLLGLWGMDGGVSAAPYAEQVTRRESVETSQSGETYTYSYDLPVDPFTGEHVVPPDAPYEGTEDGPGPLIPFEPSSWESAGGAGTGSSSTRTSSYMAWNEVDLDVSSELYALWLGPRADCALGERLTCFVRPMVSCNALSVDVDRTETWITDTVVLDTWDDHACETEWLWGAGLHAGIDLRFAETWAMGVFGGYDWVEEARVDVGPNTVELDPSGYSVGLTITKTWGSGK